MPETRFSASVPALLPHLDTFAQSYVAAALWLASDDRGDEEGNGGTPLEDTDLDADDIAPEALASMLADCADFQTANADDLAKLANDSQAGVDFWLTRNGHGAGFWDRGNGALGDRLAEAARVYGSTDLYIGDDGRIYVS